MDPIGHGTDPRPQSLSVSGLLVAVCVVAFAALIVSLPAKLKKGRIVAAADGEAKCGLAKRLSRREENIGFRRFPTGPSGDLYVFSDFTCPACRELVPKVVAMLQRPNSGVGLVYFNFPLPSHRYSFDAAEAFAAAANEACGWDMFDRLYAGSDLSMPGLIGIWRQVGLDEATLNSRMGSRAFVASVKDSVALGRAYRVQATPTLVLVEPSGRARQLFNLQEVESAIDARQM